MNASFAMSFLFLFAGNGGDLLDLMPTEDYWKAKGVEVSAATMLAELAPAEASAADAWIAKLGDDKIDVREEATRKLLAIGAAAVPALREAAKSKDAEVSARAQMLVDRLSGGGPKAAEVRRLMAIRALGELKAKDALPILARLADSKELFVADYARAAAAAIEGKPAPPRAEVSAEDSQKDLALLSPGCGLVAQARLKAGALPKIDDLLAIAPEEERERTREEIIRKGLLKAAETVGNVRILGATLGVSSEISDDAGFVVAAIRGVYDSNAMADVIRREGPEKHETVEGLEVLRPDRNVGIILPSSDRLVFVGGPARRQPLPIEAVVKAIKAGGTTLDASDPMTKLIESADRKKTVWAVAKISEDYRNLDFLQGIDTATLEADAKGDQVALSLTARAVDANAAEASLQVLQGHLKMAREGIQQAVQRMPGIQPIADFLDSVKLSADGATIKGTAALKDPAKGLSVFLMGVRGGRASSTVRQAPVAAPARAVDPGPLPRE